MASYLPIVKVLESTNISVRGLGQVVVDPATIEVGNNSVVARCKVEGLRGYKAIKCYRSSQHNEDIKGVSYYSQSLRVHDISGRVEYVDVAISRWIDGQPLDVLIDRGNCDFKALSRNFDAMALNHLKKGVIHGDIKPENIIVLRSGKMTLIDNDQLQQESVGNLKAMNYGTEHYVHRHRHIRRTDVNTDHYSLALQSAFLAAHVYNPTFLHERGTMDSYIAKVVEILRENNDMAHYDLIVASQRSIMGKVEGIVELFQSIIVADE